MPESTLKQYKILLVEDDEAQAHLVRLAVGRCGGNVGVIHVRNGDEAVGYLNEIVRSGEGHLPALILLDLKMPKMDGHEFLSVIKNDHIFRTIPVVVLTTSSSDEDRTRAYANRVNSYLVKPLNFEDFEHMIQDVKIYWCHWNEQPVVGAA